MIRAKLAARDVRAAAAGGNPVGVSPDPRFGEDEPDGVLRRLPREVSASEVKRIAA